MRRLASLAVVVALLTACSFLGGDRPPVLAVELEAAPGFTLDAVALEDARALISKRLAATSSRGARVSIAGTKIRVELDATAAAQWPDVKSAVVAPSALSFLPIATSSPFMDELRIEVERAGIEALRDEWASSPSDAIWTFRATDRDADALRTDMQKLVATVTGSDPRWDVVIDGSGAHRECRVCVLVVDRQRGMERVQITGATAQKDDFGSATVRVTLSPADAQRFEMLTGSMVKRKLAIVLDGVATSSPVVQEAISGGNVQILMGREKSATALKREATALAAALSSGTLPAPLVVSAERTLDATH